MALGCNRQTWSVRGLTRVEIFWTIVSVIVLVAALAITVNHASGTRRDRADAKMLDQIHKGLIVAASSNEGLYLPVPGLLHRSEVLELGAVPDRGEEDRTKNTTAHMYSLCIAQSLLWPEMLVSMRDRNPAVVVDGDYDFDAYNPAQGRYWDTTFTADLETGSNVSYAHMPIESQFQLRRRSAGGVFTVLGNRGPQDGVCSSTSFTCDERGAWNGYLVQSDGAMIWQERWGGPDQDRGDDVFISGDGGATDEYISFTRRVIGLIPEFQHD